MQPRLFMRAHSRQRGSVRLTVILALAIVIAVAWLIYTHGRSEPASAKRTNMVPSPVQPAVRPVFNPSAPLSQTNATLPTTRGAGEPHAAQALPETITPPKLDLLKRVTPPKKPHLVVSPGIRRAGVTNAPNSYATFRTTPERILSQLLRTPPGSPILLAIPISPDFDREFTESLKNMIEIYETDTPEEENHKIAVGWMKDELRKLAETGSSPAQLIAEYRQQLNELAALRLELQRQLAAFMKAGDNDAAELFLVEANKMLESYGAKPLILPPNRRPQE